jgi:hypothetical protein
MERADDLDQSRLEFLRRVSGPEGLLRRGFGRNFEALTVQSNGPRLARAPSPALRYCPSTAADQRTATPARLRLRQGE